MKAILNACGDGMLVVLCLYIAYVLTEITMYGEAAFVLFFTLLLIGEAAFVLFFTLLLIGESIIWYRKRKRNGS